jgi:hypothetical protein
MFSKKGLDTLVVDQSCHVDMEIKTSKKPTDFSLQLLYFNGREHTYMIQNKLIVGSSEKVNRGCIFSHVRPFYE